MHNLSLTVGTLRCIGIPGMPTTESPRGFILFFIHFSCMLIFSIELTWLSHGILLLAIPTVPLYFNTHNIWAYRNVYSSCAFIKMTRVQKGLKKGKVATFAWLAMVWLAILLREEEMACKCTFNCGLIKGLLIRAVRAWLVNLRFLNRFCSVSIPAGWITCEIHAAWYYKTKLERSQCY